VGDDWDEDTTATESLLVNGELGADRKRGCLTVLTGSATGAMFKLPRGTAMIGRAHDAEVRILDDGVSRHHARLRYDTGGLWVSDLDSRNGTFVNGNKITAPTALQNGDKVQIGGTTVLRFAYHDELDDSFHEGLLSSALRDPLTKLFNKRYLMDRLDSELKFANRHKTSLSLLMLDIDHFKAVNDGHGHLAGDAVLANFAQVLGRAVRNEDVVARFGGEEIAIVLRAISIDPAFALGERLRRLIELTVTEFGGSQLRATVSIGVAGIPPLRTEVVADLVGAADRALYRAKDAGRNCVMR